MKLLFIGDIVGRSGRRAVARWLPEVYDTHQPDIVIANAENTAGGLGATPDVLDELRQTGIDAFTMGNHVWRKKVMADVIDKMADVVRPANYPPETPGRGAAVIRLSSGGKLGLLNLLGRVFMEPLDCPFRRADEELAWLRGETDVILADIHAEATSEKIALGWHLDGAVSAVIGTHTHVQTADEWILPGGTAYITDAGMCGPVLSVIGVERDIVLRKFLTGMPEKFNVARGPLCFNAVFIEADDRNGRAFRIERIAYRDSITDAT
jgi:2',3'-cyclic-nucleotide 2'-phosphodiesterase